MRRAEDSVNERSDQEWNLALVRCVNHQQLACRLERRRHPFGEQHQRTKLLRQHFVKLPVSPWCDGVYPATSGESRMRQTLDYAHNITWQA